MKQTEALIIGGGLSGLMAMWQLNRAGVDCRLVEARSRFGGRIWTIRDEYGAQCDMGPSWFWPGQPLVASLLEHFNIPYYEQYAIGSTLFQHPDGSLVTALDTSPMAGSYRVDGGIGRLVEAIAHEIAPERCHLEHAVTGLTLAENDVVVKVEGLSENMTIQAQKVAFAIPPRLVADLALTPTLPDAVMRTLANTPTWMAGHAKFFAVYEKPFWREKGLCGSAISRRGPLAEIHDASPNSGNVGALFGFVGLDAQGRASMGREELIRHATTQLVAIFGEEASQPLAVHFQDWSSEAFTAGTADQQPQTRHPQYGLTLNFGEDWGERLALISSETSYDNGGLIEGALEAGMAYAQRNRGADLSLIGDVAKTHTASMDWEWFS